MPKIEESGEATMLLKEEEFGEKKEMQVPTVHWDDRFACDEREGETLALLVPREMASKAMQSSFFPGEDGQHIIHVVRWCLVIEKLDGKSLIILSCGKQGVLTS